MSEPVSPTPESLPCKGCNGVTRHRRWCTATLSSPTPESPRNWTEDAEHENGQYINTCIRCGETFIGHKRRVTCKLCASTPESEQIGEMLDRLDRESSRLYSEDTVGRPIGEYGAQQARVAAARSEILSLFARLRKEIETQKQFVQWGVDENTFLRERLRKDSLTPEEAECLLWELDRDEEHPYFTASAFDSVTQKLRRLSSEKP